MAHLICEELHAESAVDNVARGALEAWIDDANKRGAEGVVILELHHQPHVVHLLVFLQSLHVLDTSFQRRTIGGFFFRMQTNKKLRTVPQTRIFSPS